MLRGREDPGALPWIFSISIPDLRAVESLILTNASSKKMLKNLEIIVQSDKGKKVKGIKSKVTEHIYLFYSQLSTVDTYSWFDT